MNCPKTVWHGTTILLTSSFLRSGIQRGFHDLWGLSWRNSRPGMTRQLGQELSGGIVIHIPGVWCCQVGPQLGLSAGAPTSGLSCLSFLTAGFGVPKVSAPREPCGNYSLLWPSFGSYTVSFVVHFARTSESLRSAQIERNSLSIAEVYKKLQTCFRTSKRHSCGLLNPAPKSSA